MKKAVIVLNIIILSIMSISITSAKSEDLFLEHLTDVMWEDCEGKDLHINQPGILIYTTTKENVTLIKWPEYDKEYLRNILKILDEQPYRDYLGRIGGGAFVDSGWDGNGILTCGNNRLDIDYDTYYWNGMKVAGHEKLFNIASGSNNTQIINKGENNAAIVGNDNIANTGNGNTITQEHLYLNFGTGFAIGAILTQLANILIPCLRKKKKRSAS